MPVLLYFLLVSEAWAQDNNFLQSTLNKIQKERLDVTDEFNETDFGSDFNGEIILETDDAAFEINSDDQRENSFADNNDSIKFHQTAMYIPKIHQISNIHSTKAEEIKDDGIKGYYYYYYPLNHYLEKQKGEDVSKDPDDMNAMMETMMKNSMMQNQESKVTPLFRAMTWFIGTAMVFVLSILLMPRFKVKKAKVKSASWEDYEVSLVFPVIGNYIPQRSVVNWKNK